MFEAQVIVRRSSVDDDARQGAGRAGVELSENSRADLSASGEGAPLVLIGASKPKLDNIALYMQPGIAQVEACTARRSAPPRRAAPAFSRHRLLPGPGPGPEPRELRERRVLTSVVFQAVTQGKVNDQHGHGELVPMANPPAIGGYLCSTSTVPARVSGRASSCAAISCAPGREPAAAQSLGQQPALQPRPPRRVDRQDRPALRAPGSTTSPGTSIGCTPIAWWPPTWSLTRAWSPSCRTRTSRAAPRMPCCRSTRWRPALDLQRRVVADLSAYRWPA